MRRRRPCRCGRRAWRGLAPRRPTRNAMGSVMSITCTRANPVSRLSAASVLPAPFVPARPPCAPLFAVRQTPQTEVTAIGAADLSQGNVNGLKIAPCPGTTVPRLANSNPAMNVLEQADRRRIFHTALNAIFVICRGSSSICVTLVRITRQTRARGNSTPTRPICCTIRRP